MVQMADSINDWLFKNLSLDKRDEEFFKTDQRDKTETRLKFCNIRPRLEQPGVL